MRYIYVKSKFNYDSPGSKPEYVIENMDIRVGYYGYWHISHKLYPNEIVESGKTTQIYNSDVRLADYIHSNNYQIMKFDLFLSKEFDRYTIYDPGNFFSSNPNPGVLIQTSSSGQSSLLQMFIILCLLSQIGGLYSFIHWLVSVVFETINKKLYQMEIINLLRFLKVNTINVGATYHPQEFNLNRAGSRVKPIPDGNSRSIVETKNENSVPFMYLCI